MKECGGWWFQYDSMPFQPVQRRTKNDISPNISSDDWFVICDRESLVAG